MVDRGETHRQADGNVDKHTHEIRYSIIDAVGSVDTCIILSLEECLKDTQ